SLSARCPHSFPTRRSSDLGSLALHRNGMNEASPLKVGTYLACGLPVIIGYRDTRFPDGAPFLLNIGNHENNVGSSIPRIESFVRSKSTRLNSSHVSISYAV